MKLKLLILSAGILFIVACKKQHKDAGTISGQLCYDLNNILTEAIGRDHMSPPVASRVCVYPMVAAYEAARPFYPGYKSMAGQLHDLSEMPKPANVDELDMQLAVLRAYIAVAKNFSISGHSIQLLEDFEGVKIDELSKGLDAATVEKSLAFGDTIAFTIKKWVKTDHFTEVKKAPKFKPGDAPGNWLPTYPDYADAICPEWMTMRLMVLKTSDQVKIPPPTHYDSTEGSPYWKECRQVYDAVNRKDSSEQQIAYFWDDNPVVTEHFGHLSMQELKMTPGAHWMNITSTVCRDKKVNLITAIEAHMRVAISMYDGFIACWFEKYKTNYIRPITFIRRYWDKEWTAFLQTPPFPEYPSGHSVVSRAAAATLTGIFGEKTTFTDSTEFRYGHGVRSFGSFYEASDQAAISRMYGGIHYIPAIENGKKMGAEIGAYVNENMKTKE